MKILKDSIFKIGKSHSVCQDYASHDSDIPNTPNMIVLSDGCSSSKNTDFGARILVRTKFDPLLYSDNVSIFYIANRFVSKIGMDVSTLDATLLSAVIENEKLLFSIVGDGVFSYRLKTGSTKIVEFHYENNAPYYLTYIFPSRKKEYLDVFGGKKTITEYTVQDGKITDKQEKIVNYNECNDYEFNINNLSSFFMFSDGVETFHQVIKTETSKFTKDISTTDSVLEIMKCPTFGPFLEKKYTKLSEQYAKEGIFHSDDLSVAAFLFQDD